jgi:hypothetical protein
LVDAVITGCRLARLRDDHTTILVLATDGTSPHDIATALGLEVGTVLFRFRTAFVRIVPSLPEAFRRALFGRALAISAAGHDLRTGVITLDPDGSDGLPSQRDGSLSADRPEPLAAR